MTTIIGFVITMALISLFWRWIGHLETRSRIKREELQEYMRSQRYDPNLIDPMNPEAEELRAISKKAYPEFWKNN